MKLPKISTKSITNLTGKGLLRLPMKRHSAPTNKVNHRGIPNSNNWSQVMFKIKPLCAGNHEAKSRLMLGEGRRREPNLPTLMGTLLKSSYKPWATLKGSPQNICTQNSLGWSNSSKG